MHFSSRYKQIFNQINVKKRYFQLESEWHLLWEFMTLSLQYKQTRKCCPVGRHSYLCTDLRYLIASIPASGGRLSIKMPSYQYRDPHAKDKTVLTVLSLTWKSPYLGKTVFILRQDPGCDSEKCRSVQRRMRKSNSFRSCLLLTCFVKSVVKCQLRLAQLPDARMLAWGTLKTDVCRMKTRPVV